MSDCNHAEFLCVNAFEPTHWCPDCGALRALRECHEDWRVAKHERVRYFFSRQRIVQIRRATADALRDCEKKLLDCYEVIRDEDLTVQQKQALDAALLALQAARHQLVIGKDFTGNAATPEEPVAAEFGEEAKG